MRAKVSTVLLAGGLSLAMAVAGCGQVKIDEELPSVPSVPSVTTVTTARLPATTVATLAPPPTTPPPTAAGGRTCLAILTDSLKLASDYSLEQRGVAGADEAKYRARAQVLADEARSEGCQVPPVIEPFLR